LPFERATSGCVVGRALAPSADECGAHDERFEVFSQQRITPVGIMKTMSAVRETPSRVLSEPVAAPRSRASFATSAMDLLSSVRFGVALLVLLAAACMVGMLIMQVNVEGFGKYYAELSPSQRLLYGKLGFFDIYHAWYFNALLLVLSLNIILSSVDHLPKAWTYVSRKKTDASAHWLRGQEQSATLALEREPAHMQTLQNLTVAYTRKGDAAQARATIGRLEAVNPNSAALPRLRADVEGLRSSIPSPASAETSAASASKK
jgi:hypothetical protein